MREQLMANIRTNFIFYWRSRIVLAAVVFVIIFLGMIILQPALSFSSMDAFNTVRLLLKIMNGFVMIFTMLLGVLHVTEHLKNRSIKMIFAKPCLPETWLLAGLLSAAMVSFVLHAASLTAAAVLSSVLETPFLSGTVVIAANDYFQAVSLMAFATLLALVVHPLIAVMILIFIQEGQMYTLKTIVAEQAHTAIDSLYRPLWKVLKITVDGAYLVFPTFQPYSERTVQLYASHSMSSGDALYIALAVAYALVATTLFYLLGVAVLKKKRYV